MAEILALTKNELIASFRNESRILLHLAGKIDSSYLDFRPTPGQRSTIELLRFLSVNVPGLSRVVRTGKFDPEAWASILNSVHGAGLDETVAAIQKQGTEYTEFLSGLSEADFRSDIEVNGNRSSRGAFIVNTGLCGAAAYRMQLFLYLKACGRHELNTMNLWAGVDPPGQS